MKKSQVSFEFIVLFAIVLFVFIALISFFPGWLEKTASTKAAAESIAKDIKVKAITASLSESDFESIIVVPKKINNVNNITMYIIGDPDNILTIDDGDKGRVLAKVFLPNIDNVTGPQEGLNITIKKDVSTNQLTIERRII